VRLTTKGGSPRTKRTRTGDVGVLEIESVHHNIPLDDILFEPPNALY
jgi:hypothetical protein